MTATAGRIAGWYDDDTDAAVLRYWDGAGWTPHTAGRPDAESALFRTLRLPERAAGDVPAGTGQSSTGLTQWIEGTEPRDHTTVPTAPTAQAVPTAQAGAHPRAFVASSARPVVQLTVIGALTAGVSLVVACAALAVALGR